MLISREYAKQQIGKQEIMCNNKAGTRKQNGNDQPKDENKYEEKHDDTNTTTCENYFNDTNTTTWENTCKNANPVQ